MVNIIGAADRTVSVTATLPLQSERLWLASHSLVTSVLELIG